MAMCEGKKRYSSEKEANRGRMNLWGADPHADLTDLHVYLCSSCKGWHVGHKSKYERSGYAKKNHAHLSEG